MLQRMLPEVALSFDGCAPGQAPPQEDRLTEEDFLAVLNRKPAPPPADDPLSVLDRLDRMNGG